MPMSQCALVRPMTGKARPLALAGLMLAAAAVTACLGPNPSPTSTTRPTSTASQTRGSSPVLTSIDPCRLLTLEQASALNGVPYKGGDAQTLTNGLSVCSWDNADAPATVEVGFSFWPSAAAAQVAYDAALASASAGGLTVTPVAGLADGAAITRQTPTPNATGAGNLFSGADNIFVLRDALFLMVGYYNGAAPTDTALEAAASLVLGELPRSAR